VLFPWNLIQRCQDIPQTAHWHRTSRSFFTNNTFKCKAHDYTYK
jgi:hypothetical protein